MRAIILGAVLALSLAGPSFAGPIEVQLATADKLFNAGKHPEALKTAKAAMAAAEATGDQLLIAKAQASMGGIFVGMGRMDEAEPALKAALDIRMAKLGPDHPDTLLAMSEYSGWLAFQGRDREAEPILAKAAAGMRKTAKTADDRVNAAEAQAGHGMVLFNLGRWEEGEREIKDALVRLDGPDTPPDRSTPMAFMSVLSEAYYRWGRYDDALQMAQATLAMRERKQGPDHPEIAGTLDKLALIQLSLGDEGGAEQSYRRSLKIAEKNYPDGPLLAQAVQNLANFYSVTGRSDDALPLFKRAAEINANDKTYRAGETYQSYAMAKLRAGQAEEAEALAEKALELFDANQGPESEPSGATHLTLARIQFALGKNDEAGKHGEKGLAIYRKVLSAGNPRIGDALFQLGFAAQRRRDRDRAEALYAEALEAMGTRRPPHHEAVINTRSSLANQILIGKKEPARAYETADLAASALEGRVLANARLVGRAGTPTLSAADRNVFFIAVRTAWAYSESLPPQ